MRIAGVLIGAVALTATGCATQKVAIRAVGGLPASAAADRIGYAHGQLALGNVALALESYRRAAREDPASVAALVGMADCYDRMGRFDLSRRNYEAALALAPTDGAVLARMATSLDLAGSRDEAAAVRKEIAAVASASVTVALPTAAPVKAAAPKVAEVVTVTLPTEPIVEHSASGPRLERLSFGEVALVTSAKPRWRVPQSAAPVQFAAPSIRLLNAARAQGLAARTRAYLSEQGWRRLAIGNAPAPLARSVILYPTTRRVAAERLGRELGVTVLRPNRAPEIVMLLGRDMSGRRAAGMP
ncbi:LytR C-terminal domain-containing protein [Sphingomonas sp. BN140010]|uniref:LytR C-terminal domain-containing protein n=1 Tax=Sphingomonas arvum TaxID=2992113 RepID=A0ABT3JDN9_9SPHN|nr:LytR C-terminal domain-containing protein [Sphingomonas sp. BN140010]MCW3797184.1 LytR C-terminal domain-containing protein [Sphingomonas sp. BN140010]